MHKSGFSEREVSSKVNRSKIGVHKTVSKFKILVKFTDLKRSSRPRKTSTNKSV